MTGPRDEEDEHLVIHVDASAGDRGHGEAGGEKPVDETSLRDESRSFVAEEPEETRPPLLQRYRYWLYGLAALCVMAGAGYAVGEATYHPPSRLPALVFSTQAPLYGTNTAVASELDLLRETFTDPNALRLQPAGRAVRIALPRTVADRLFGEGDEAATIFTARSPAGDFRFLVLSEDGVPRMFAVEAPFGRGRPDQPTGVFLALNPADAAFEPLFDALETALPAFDKLPVLELSSEDVYVFGPYLGGDADALRDRIEGSVVMMHLAGAIEAADGDVSMAAPMLLVASGPSRGTINAIYHPARRVVLEPLWGESSTASLAHELVHAYLDTVVANRSEVLSSAADYLERAHPVLHGEVVGDLYERLGREGRAEETLAFITGAIAAQQTKTVSTQRLIENPGNLAISEAILYSDVGLLVQIGLLPPCVLPNEGATGEITPAFYEMVAETCDE